MECISLVNKKEREGRSTPSFVRRRAPLFGEGDLLTTSGSAEKMSSRESSESDADGEGNVTSDLLTSSSCRIDKESSSDLKGKTDLRRFSTQQKPSIRFIDRCFGCGEKIVKTEVPNIDVGLEISITVDTKTFRVAVFIVIFFLTVAILRICKQCFTCWRF